MMIHSTPQRDDVVRFQQLSLTGVMDERTIDERFAVFHAQHPEVYRLLRAYARQARRAGVQRLGIRMLWERLRWHVEIERTAGEPFVLNDHFPSRYARLLMARERDLEGLFETRTIRTR